MDLKEYFKKQRLTYYPITIGDNYIGIICKKRNKKTSIVGYVRETKDEYIADLEKKTIKIKRL